MLLGFPGGFSLGQPGNGINGLGQGGLGQGGRAFIPIPNNPASQGGPIYRSPLLVTRNEPGTGRMVRRAPWNVTPDMESGARPFMNQGKAFTPEGKLVPYSAFPPNTFQKTGSLAGALAGATADPTEKAARSLFFWGILGGAMAGFVIGAVVSSRDGAGRMVDSAVGGGLGAVTGMAASILVGRGAFLASQATLERLA